MEKTDQSKNYLTINKFLSKIEIKTTINGTCHTNKTKEHKNRNGRKEDRTGGNKEELKKKTQPFSRYNVCNILF